MTRAEKTVFICYRRTNAAWALAISQYLTTNGFDAFVDYQEIASGDFAQVILENIRARAHFLVLLTPSALERCDVQGDWFRREIEEALETRRNVVPLLLEGFDFSAPATETKLTGKLAVLNRYNALTIPAAYFEAAMTKLRDKFLDVPLETVLHPPSELAKEAARIQKPKQTHFNSCFISFSTKDGDFAQILHDDLTKRGVKCWFSPHDIRGGETLHDQIHNAIHLMDKLLLILSEHSIQSPWVKTEIIKAKSRERQEKRKILFPIRLVNYEKLRAWEYIDSDTGTDLAQEIRGYFIPDFSQWEQAPQYQSALERLLRDLRQTSSA